METGEEEGKWRQGKEAGKLIQGKEEGKVDRGRSKGIGTGEGDWERRKYIDFKP